jgi:pimeloyl-ACP methyl ester carboxylesterase
MGGGIVQEIALQSPQKLLSLTLHDTSCKFEMSDPVMVEWRRQRLEMAETKGMAAVAALPPPVPPPPHMPAQRLQETALRLASMSVDAFVGAMTGLIEWEGTVRRAAEISVPTLIIYGALDGPALIKGCQRLAELIPNATVEVVPECGHSPQYECPDLFNQALRRHLEANRASN